MSNTNARTPSLPVPEELHIFHVPTDINAYLSKLLPNMRELMRRKKIHDPVERDEIVNTFIGYFVGHATNHGGVLRYTLYSPVHGLPFFKYVLNRLDFFRRSHVENRFEENRVYAYGIIDSDTPRETLGPGKFINIDNFGAEEIEDAITGAQTNDQMRDYFAALQNAYVEVERKGNKAEKPTFEAVALDLFDALMDEVPSAELTQLMEQHKIPLLSAFAKSKGVSTSAVNGWRKRMQEQVIDMLGYDPRRPKKVKATGGEDA